MCATLYARSMVMSGKASSRSRIVIVGSPGPLARVVSSSAWPAHVTVAPVFAIADQERLSETLREVACGTDAVTIVLGPLANFGPANLPVLLANHPSLLALHETLTARLAGLPEFRPETAGHWGSGYRAHVTLSETARTQPGDRFAVDTLTAFFSLGPVWQSLGEFALQQLPRDVRDRRAARILLIDEAGRTLLLRGRDPSKPELGFWWFTPGGGIESGESSREAAHRELLEETGLRLEKLNGPIHFRNTNFSFDGDEYRQHEEYFYARVPSFAISEAGWTDLERQALTESRWWSVDELQATGETVYPTELKRLVSAIIETS
jgi:8-oxo-dGTP pyrophosphatase MutT (NUDIX family)